jgi:hypothetical protein
MIFATTNGKLDSGQDQIVAQLKAELSKPGAKMLLHLHGGLVNDRAGRDTAARLAASAPDGWGLAADWSQVYVVWRTGVFETISTNWLDLAHDDRLYKVVLEKLMWFVAGKLGVPGQGGRSAAAAVGLTEAEIRSGLRGERDRRAPFANVDQRAELSISGGRGPVLSTQDDGDLALEFQDILSQDAEFNAAAGDIDAVVNAKTPGRAALSDGDKVRGERSYDRLDRKVREPIEKLRPTGEGGRVGPVGVAAFLLKHAGRIAFRCFKRFRTRRDHGFHATLVEEVAREMYGDLLGAKIWGMMVKDAADHFETGGFGLELLKALPDDNPIHLVVTAHSAGSIWVAQMLRAVKAIGKKVSFDLVLLAPAVRTDLFAEAVTSAGKSIVRCRMLTMDDELERGDAVLGHDKGYIYPSSLLYLVSGMFEEFESAGFVDAPLVGMQRFTKADWPDDKEQASAVKTVADFFTEPGHDIIYSPAPGITTADSHSGFTTEHLTLASVVKFLSGQ